MCKSEGRPGHRPVLVATLALLVGVAIATFAAADAKAAYYKMVACSGSNGIPSPGLSVNTNTRSSTYPNGIFHLWNFCDGQGGDPPGDGSFIRIQEHKGDGQKAGNTAYGHLYMRAPGGVHFKTVGAYTRQPDRFNDGWRARVWIGSCCATAQIISVGKGLPGSGGQGGPTSGFVGRPWPLEVFYDFDTVVFEMTCASGGGCSTDGTNTADFNGLDFVMADERDAEVSFTDTGSDLLAGRWVSGGARVTFRASDAETGVRRERVRVDGAERWVHNHGCATSSSARSGEWARNYRPCGSGPHERRVYLNTRELADGSHALAACAQDFGQYQGLYGTGSESCAERTIRTDNTAPGKPAQLEVTSANPERYLPEFGARWSLPPDPGSPIAKVHYDVIDAEGRSVVPERTLVATDPTSLPEVKGPAERGPYRMRVWLEDEVGHVGPAATAPVPRDTEPPAAPQDLRIAGTSTERWAQRFGLRWRNVADAGSPVIAAFYEVRDRSGEIAIRARTVRGNDVESVGGARSPLRRGHYTARVWLRDAEGNVGAAAKVALPLDTEPPAAPQGVSVAPSGASRAAAGFDLRWHNIADAGSPIEAAHYRVLNAAGGEVVPTTTVAGPNVEAIAALNAPSARGPYALRLWLSDAEGNVGAPVSVPLSYSCVRSDAGPGAALTSAIARKGRKRVLVRQGRGAALRGRLFGAGGAGVPGAPLCVFSRVATEARQRFMGIALTGAEGRYRFPVPAGPNRGLTVVHRFGHRRIAAGARIATKVRPTFGVRRRVVRNKTFARFRVCIPGPHNAGVLVTLQVKRGEGWLAFRRYRTRRDGCATIVYRFIRTDRPTFYPMRAEVRKQGGYPYVQGTSRPLRLIVLPARN